MSRRAGDASALAQRENIAFAAMAASAEAIADLRAKTSNATA